MKSTRFAMLVRDGQDGADRIGRIAVTQLRGKPVVAKTTLERGELVRMNSENRVRVHTRSHGTMHRRRHRTNDCVGYVRPRKRIDRIEQKKRRLAGPLRPHRRDFGARARRSFPA